MLSEISFEFSAPEAVACASQLRREFIIQVKLRPMTTVQQQGGSAELLAGLRANDPRVLHEFYYRLRRITSRTLLPRFGVQYREVFAEAFTDAFLILLRKVQGDAYEHRNLPAFAYGIVKYTFRDAVRRRRNREISTAPEELPDHLPREMTPIYATAAEWLEDLDHAKLLQWYRQLSARDQRLLDLRLQGYSLQEMAVQCGLAYGTVRNVYAGLLREAGGLVP